MYPHRKKLGWGLCSSGGESQFHTRNGTQCLPCLPISVSCPATPLLHPPADVDQFDKKPLHSTAHDQVVEYKSSPSLHPTPHPLHYSQIIASLSPDHSPYPIRRRGLSIHHLMITPARPALKSSPHQPPYHNHQTALYQ